MLSANDLIKLPFTPDLSEAGIACALRSLPLAPDPVDGSTWQRLRRIVAGTAAELALRRWLGEQQVPFDVRGATAPDEPGHYDVALGGRRCGLQTFLLGRREQIRLVERDPSVLLDAPALVPLDRARAGGYDLHLFAFLTGLTAGLREESERARAADQPVAMVHPLPWAWSRPAHWTCLDPLVLKSESDEPLELELCGLGPDRGWRALRLSLPPRRRVVVHSGLHALTCLSMARAPAGRVGLVSPRMPSVYIAAPHEWGNLWIYGRQVWLAGWLAHEEFIRKAELLPAGARVLQVQRTRVRNLSVPVRALRPLGPLLDRVRAWERGSALPAEAHPEGRKPVSAGDVVKGKYGT